MKQPGFRQTNAWLHTWTGLLLGWLLYAVFLTGTLSFFHQEISYWMKPELHTEKDDGSSASHAINYLQQVAPTAGIWRILLPTERNPGLEVRWFEPGERVGRGSGQRQLLNVETGEEVTPRATRGGDFLYRFHFELYGIPRITARWIVGIATMFMLVAIVSGVVTHKKIFKDFFTFRPRKGSRSWLDAHNATAVLALPFHFMITYSGLLLFMYMLMPWGISSAYQGDMQAYFSESGNRRAALERGVPAQPDPAAPITLTAIEPLIAQAEQQWERGVAGIRVTQPATPQAVIELYEQGGDSLIEGRRSDMLRFDGVSGKLLDNPAEHTAVPVTNAVYSVFRNLHLIRFAGPPLRWLFFLSGVLGTAMIATGLILWVSKRLPQRQKLGRTPVGHRLVETLNVGTVAGLPLAIAAYFWANRLLPVELAQRSDWEIRCFLITWLLCLLHPLLRSYKRAWQEQLLVAALLFAGLPLFSLTLPNTGLPTSLAGGNWLLAGIELTLLATAALLGFAAYMLSRRQPQTRASSKKAAAGQTVQIKEASA